MKRHSRILKYNISSNNLLKRTKNSNYGYNLVLFVVIFLLPIYPLLSSIVYGNNEYEFYRGDIDESSIIGTYYSDDLDLSNGVEKGGPVIESSDSFLSINAISNGERDLSGTNEVIDYKVQPGDSISSIAYSFKVSNDSILWANDFGKNHIIHPGDIIKVPPVSGLIHQVKSGDTISKIALEYDVPENKIIEQNLISLDNTKIKIGDVLIIPGAIRKVPEVIVKAPVKNVLVKNTNTNNNNTKSYDFVETSKTTYSDSKGSYALTWRKPLHTFYWGNCTWYVAQYKNVNWSGNAKDWLKNAKAKGHSTSMTPKLGSIVVFNGKGYNPRYGHVGIVMEIKGTELIVSDMNYRELGEITYRKVSVNDRAIIGYIHVD